MDYRKLKSGSDVRGVAVGEGATLTPDVAKTLGMAFARYVAGKTGKPVERVSIALGRDSRVSGPQLLEAAAQGDEQACEQMLRDNSGLIWSIVRRYYGRGVEPDDLYQLGCLGFIKAVKGFDITFGTQFSTYAVPKIGRAHV